MRAVVQRTKRSRVLVNAIEKAGINEGLVVLLGIKRGDKPIDGEYLMDKVINLRVFEDADEKMNRSLMDINGEILLVSQFTLYGDVRKGRRPSFTESEQPEIALPLFDFCANYVKNQGIKVETGIFGADMQVEIQNDGPCTILLDSEKLF
ncbi:MAG: D-tyrosyl-tRNA(Tyr) deacylase [Firmicutes bacterium HGW-Firmicutes-15]|nr:MAG: D-tyrosyl-tRNA(Tyr) deacylase [Firmicutes bacterium HGW-Firmicutes-15]